MIKGHEKEFGGKLVSYAQNAEDIKLYGYFHNIKQPGFYVDIGANHPVNDSVTKFFYLRGWRGINIEPQMRLYELLKVDRPKDKNLAIGISDKAEVAVLRQYAGDGLSTFSEEHKKGYENADSPLFNNYSEVKLKLKTLEEILAKFSKNIEVHFLKVDVEGFEYKTLKGNNWKKNRPWVICIESTGQDKRWVNILSKARYIKHLSDGLNDYYVAQEHSELIQNYRAVTSSESIRFDIVDMPALRYLGYFGVVRRAIVKRLALFNSD